MLSLRFFTSRAMGACLAVLGLACAAGCDDDKSNKPPAGDAGVDASEDGDVIPMNDAEVLACTALEGDYAPGATDDWDACISDDGEYHKIMDTVSTEARIQAFVDMADAIFTPSADPSATDFDDARDLYTTAEGLASRVGRRYDPHFPNPDDVDCGAADGPTLAANADYCVGPAILQPIINDAFAAGQTEDDGEPARVYGARIEAAVLWFLYASLYKESLTCTTTAKDCDSSWAYVTGGGPVEKGGETGLGGYVRDLDDGAADRIWNGALAVRCWRDLDAEATATDTELRDAARDQFDRATIDGVALIVADRLNAAKAATGSERAYHVAFVKVLARALYREMDEGDGGAQDDLEAALADDAPSDGDIDAALAAIAGVFPTACVLE
jgi:hypothetical protein